MPDKQKGTFGPPKRTMTGPGRGGPGANVQRIGGVATPGSSQRPDLTGRLSLPEIRYMNRAKGISVYSPAPGHGVFTPRSHSPHLQQVPKQQTELLRPGGGTPKAKPDRIPDYDYGPGGPNWAATPKRRA